MAGRCKKAELQVLDDFGAEVFEGIERRLACGALDWGFVGVEEMGLTRGYCQDLARR